MNGWTAVDVGCGSGDVSFDLAGRVGPQGKAICLDVDEVQLAIVRTEAKDRAYEYGFFSDR
jgi:ubiquinone/menaquinone biosynthesis C-methylase UbiE